MSEQQPPAQPKPTASTVDQPARTCQLLQLLATMFMVAAGVFGLVALGESIRRFAELGRAGAPINARLPLLLLGFTGLVLGLTFGGILYLISKLLTGLTLGRSADHPGTTQFVGASNTDVLEAVEELRRIVLERPDAPAQPPRTTQPPLPPELPDFEDEPMDAILEPDVDERPEEHPAPTPAPKTRPRRSRPEPVEEPPLRLAGQQASTFVEYRNTTRQFVKEEAWDKVSRLLEGIEEKFGEDPEAAEFVRETREAMRDDHRSQLDQLREKVEALIRNEQWLDAILLAEEVQRKFPDVEKVRDFALKIRKRKIEASQDGRVIHHKQLMHQVAQKQWPEALKSAREYLELYPDAEDAADVEKMFEQIKSRHDRHQIGLLSEAIKSAIARKDYRTAYKGSLRMIKRFPDSKEARNLQAGLENLKNLADTQDAS